MKYLLEKLMQKKAVKKRIKNSSAYDVINILRDRFEKREDLAKHKIKKLINKKSPTIVEIGANNGSDSIAFLQIIPSCKLYCFEPHPRAIERFEQKLKEFRKRVKETKCELFKMAISNKNGEIDFHLAEGNWNNQELDWGSSINKPKNILKEFPFIKYGKNIKVKTTTLDDWAKKEKIALIDFIWADVEGAERELIEGGLKTLNEKTRFFYTEVLEGEFYEGQPSLQEILHMLPAFKFVKRYGDSVLLRNENLK